MSFVFSVKFTVFGYISGLKYLSLVKTIYKIISYIYLHRLQVAGIKFFIPKSLQYLRYRAQPFFRDLEAVGKILEISRPLIKKVEFVNSSYVFNPSLRQ